VGSRSPFRELEGRSANIKGSPPAPPTPKGVIYPHVQRAAGSGSPFRELEGSSAEISGYDPYTS